MRCRLDMGEDGWLRSFPLHSGISAARVLAQPPSAVVGRSWTSYSAFQQKTQPGRLCHIRTYTLFKVLHPCYTPSFWQRQPQGREHRLSFDQRFLIFRLGLGVCDDPAANGDVDQPILRNHRSDRDVEFDCAIGGEISDRPAIRPAADRLHLFDDFHCSDFRRSGNAAAGEGRAQKIDKTDFLAKDAFDCRRAVIDRRMGFDFRIFVT